MRPRTTLRRALSDPNLFGAALAGDGWRPWRVLLIAAMGEALDDDERVLFKQLTQREREPGQRVDELVGVIGRRGGKSRAISVVAAYLASCCDHPALVHGERGVCLIIAPDQRQADIVLDYTTAAFEQSPILRQLIDQRIARTLRLNNNISIEVRAADFRNLRGPTYICCIADEVAFWMNENSANPDDEILGAVRPGLATTGGPLFLISSPHARKGALWHAYKQHFGAAGDPSVLVAQGSSRTFNATLLQAVIDRAYERDPASAAAEYGAEFRRDIESFVSIEAVEGCVSGGVFERGPLSEFSYCAFVDPSGGSADSMALCVGHMEHGRETVVVDCLREVVPPFSPEAVVAEFAELLLKTYRVHTISGDRYAGEWPREQFSKYGITYEPAERPKSELYGNLLPLINSRRIDLLDHPKAINQICSLERRVGRGRDSIDHPPGGAHHDDLANSIAGVADLAVLQDKSDNIRRINRLFFGSGDEAAERAEWRRARLQGILAHDAMTRR